MSGDRYRALLYRHPALTSTAGMRTRIGRPVYQSDELRELIATYDDFFLFRRRSSRI